MISYALFPQPAREFFLLRRSGKVRPIEEARVFPVERPTDGAGEPEKVVVAASRPPRPQTNYSLWQLATRMRGGR